MSGAAWRGRIKFALLGVAAATVFFLTPAAKGDARACHCATGDRAAMEQQRECSLCLEAERQPPYLEVFFLKDANPTKPNRILALPRVHAPGSHALSQLTPETRELLWAAALAKAQETWGTDWAIAYNGDERRTQCHTHLHIGKLLPAQENDRFVAVKTIAEIPAPADGTGLWVHPVGPLLHVHTGQQVNETVLMR